MRAWTPLFVLFSSAALAAEYRLSRPLVQDHATLFLVIRVEASGPPIGRRYLPLDDALRRKLVVVHETGQVNELAIQNLSPDADVFIQSGDIVKGGQQDRVFATDLILPPRSGRTKIEAFCVEQGRWSRRGSEDARRFSASPHAVVSKDAKLAIKGSKDQTAVWKSVAAVQDKLARRLGREAAVASTASPTSLQLSLENKRVAETSSRYAQAFRAGAEAEPAAVGYVFAINGEIQGADVYASPELFRALWPKQAQSLAVEAVSEKPAGSGKPPVSSEAALGFLARPGAAAPAAAPNRRTAIHRADSPKALFLESRDTAAVRGGAWLHRSYTAK